MEKYIVEIDDCNEGENWAEEFDDLEKAIEYYSDFEDRLFFSGVIYKKKNNKIICEFCNDDMED